MPTMNISLTEEIAEFVTSEVAAGEYASASEMVRDSLRVMKHAREMDEIKLELMRRHLQVGIAQAEAGQFSDRSVMDIAASILAEDDE